MSGFRDGTARAWDVESRETILGEFETGHQYMLAVAYSPDESKFATGGFTSAKMWDSTTGKLLRTFEHYSVVWCLAWNTTMSD
jgi:WD40 repeat protein